LLLPAIQLHLAHQGIHKPAGYRRQRRNAECVFGGGTQPAAEC